MCVEVLRVLLKLQFELGNWRSMLLLQLLVA